ncbi:hypothetical protein TYRP_003833 [Tyrophagus putrescentiae]|nr:hypothetical protein TYRP_003833 [Tyrophagus putrescentiae]
MSTTTSKLTFTAINISTAVIKEEDAHQKRLNELQKGHQCIENGIVQSTVLGDVLADVQQTGVGAHEQLPTAEHLFPIEENHQKLQKEEAAKNNKRSLQEVKRNFSPHFFADFFDDFSPDFFEELLAIFLELLTLLAPPLLALLLLPPLFNFLPLLFPPPPLLLPFNEDLPADDLPKAEDLPPLPLLPKDFPPPPLFELPLLPAFPFPEIPRPPRRRPPAQQ